MVDAPNDSVPEVMINPDVVQKTLKEMIDYLNNFDPAAEECLESNREVFRSLFVAEDLSRFEEEVRGFAFAEALTRIQAAAAEKGLPLS